MMEMVTISKEKFDEMQLELGELRERVREISGDSQEETDVEEDDLLRQVKASLEDLRHGRITRVA
ncbi:hypothetical protein CMI38_01600 [Candidatus Pacearchaeota archaeon]|jgi:hypothetical protein|nr:hypothetical protein [Candidatus Pacearchaeota archaeon]|tara:strand:- start:759 stop:953 length:195 start_codon:yes stop_codon:yes gene_type:complete